ncbi:hypothetical protein EV648_102303 [Kribbella sp. VKM Ac-2568]|nr:hypothetical protein EV648_102303 [Kribbella sp. VKM Ac-2568]
MLSPECRKKSGRVWCIALYATMPPISGLMPYPWPAVSPVQTKLTGRLRPGVLKEPSAVSPTRPDESSKPIR